MILGVDAPPEIATAPRSCFVVLLSVIDFVPLGLMVNVPDPFV